jgi:hypothetical protein
LNQSFVRKIMDTATVTINFEVDAYASKPNLPSVDGDLHIAGRAVEIGLPVVAEIVNAAQEPEVLDLLRQGSPARLLPVTGAWRIWFEHAGPDPQVQGAPVNFLSSINPFHFFEIHPVTQIATLNLAHADKPIPGFLPKTAASAFSLYEKLPAAVTANNTALIIDSSPAEYNYVDFILDLAGTPTPVRDGLIALANVLSPADRQPLTAVPRRMIFLKGSGPADKVAKMAVGGRLHVLGIPRINLNALLAAARKAGGKRVTIGLPYEMIIVAIVSD